MKKIVGFGLLLLFGVLSTAVLASKPQEAQEPIKLAPNGMPEGRMPTDEELLAVIESMNMSDEEKKTLREELLRQVKDESGDRPAAGVYDEDNVPHISSSIFASQFFMLTAMISIVVLIFVFFGYKLFKSLTEREKRREEKKKSKQMKKKK